MACVCVDTLRTIFAVHLHFAKKAWRQSFNEVEKIGKINTGKEEVHGEFIGMIKLSDRGTEIFKEHFKSSHGLV